MSTTLLSAANRLALAMRRGSYSDPMGAVYPRDYYRPAARAWLLRAFLITH